jgi:hypothetical protein
MSYVGIGNREAGIGKRESGIGKRESGIGKRESGIGNRDLDGWLWSKGVWGTLVALRFRLVLHANILFGATR